MFSPGIELDVHLIDGKLFVFHGQKEVQKLGLAPKGFDLSKPKAEEIKTHTKVPTLKQVLDAVKKEAEKPGNLIAHLEDVKRWSACALHIPCKQALEASPEYPAEAKKKCLKIRIYVYFDKGSEQTEDDMKFILKNGADGFLADRPDIAARAWEGR